MISATWKNQLTIHYVLFKQLLTYFIVAYIIWSSGDVPGYRSPALYSCTTGFFIISAIVRSMEFRTFYHHEGEQSVFYPIAPLFLLGLSLVPAFLEAYQRTDMRLVNLPHTPDQRVQSPEKKASLFSRMTFAWFQPMVNLGNERPLEQDDMWDLAPGDYSKSANIAFQDAKNRFSWITLRLL